MAISLFAVSRWPTTNNANDTTQNVTLTPPSNMESGDFVLVVQSVRDAAASLSIGVNGGQTWSSATEIGGNTTEVELYWCTFDGTWDANPRFDSNVGSIPHIVQMFVFRGVDTSSPFDVSVTSGAFTLDGNNDWTFSPGNTNTNGAWSIVIGASPDNNTWAIASGTGWAALDTASQLYWQSAGGSDTSEVAAYRALATAGDPGDVVLSQETVGPDAGMYYAFALKPGVGDVNISGISDTVTVTDNGGQIRLTPLLVGASDTVTVTDNGGSIQLNPLRVSATDSVTVTEELGTAQVQGGGPISVGGSDTVTVTEGTRAVQALHKLYITFALADGLSNQINFYNSCAEYTPHYPATTCLTTDNIDAGGLTSAQVTTMYNGGWEIGSHNKDAECTSPYTAELRAAYDFIVNSGWGDCRAFDAPNALNNSALATEVKKFHHYNLCHFWDFNQTPLDYEYGIDCPAYVVADYSTAQGLMDAVDTALAECDTAKTWLILHWHGFSGDETVFDTFLGNLDDRIKNHNLYSEVVNLTDGYKIFKPDYTELITVKDSVTVSEGTISVQVQVGSSIDISTPSDTVTVSESTVDIKLSRNVSASDSVTVTEQLGSWFTETVYFYEFADVQVQAPAGIINISTPADTVTVTDGGGQIFLTSRNAYATDSVTLSESATVKVDLNISAADTVTTSEQLSQIFLTSRNVSASDNVTVTDNGGVAKTVLNISATDTVTVTDTLDRIALNPLRVGGSDTATITEGVITVQPAGVVTAVASDTLTVSESSDIFLTSRNASASDSITFSESAEARVTRHIDVSDSVTVSETSNARVTPLFVTASDTVTVTDNGGSIRITPLRIFGSDAVTVTEDITGIRLNPLRIGGTDSVTVTESAVFVQAAGVVNATGSDTVTVSESSQILVLWRNVSASDSITVSESSTVFLPYRVVEVTDSVSVTETLISVGTVLAAFASDTVTVSEALYGIGLTPLRLFASDTITLAEIQPVVYIEGTGAKVIDSPTLFTVEQVRYIFAVEQTKYIHIGDNITFVTLAVDALYNASVEQ